MKKRKQRFQWPRAGLYEKDIRRTSVVRIDWIDSCTHNGWRHPDKTGEAARCTSTGFLIKRGRRFVTVASSIGDTDTVCDAITIPMSSVSCIHVMRRAPR